MRSKASCRAAPGCAAPKSLFPLPTVPTRSTPAAQSLSPCSFDVLYLLPQFLDLRLDLQRQARDCQRLAFDAGRFGQHRIRLAMHFLQKKIQLLPQLARTVKQFPELLQVTPQAVQFFTDIAAFRKHRLLLREPCRIVPYPAQQFLQLGIETTRERRAQPPRHLAHLLITAAYTPQPTPQLTRHAAGP